MPLYEVTLSKAVPDPSYPSGQRYEVVELFTISAESEDAATEIAAIEAEKKDAYYSVKDSCEGTEL